MEGDKAKMDVPEQAVLGNNEMLVTIGKHGEVRYWFWPTIDYPQHIRGSLPGLFYSSKTNMSFGWLTDIEWDKKQEYLPNSNILRTVFRHQDPSLGVTLTDIVLPNFDALLRQFIIKNMGINDVFLRLFYYNDLTLSESPIDDAAYYLLDHDAIIHYKRNFYYICGGTLPSSGHQCGVHDENSDSFKDVYDHKLSGGSLTLYDGSRDVNSCLSWDIGNLKSNESRTLTVIMAMGTEEKKVLEILKKCRKNKYENSFEITESFWKNWIKQFSIDIGKDQIADKIRRSLLTLKLLTSKTHGGIIAAPCMEPEYRFCWPRDATFVAYAFDMCGYHIEAEHFYKWCTKAQEAEGGLYQRYYIEAKIRGPCWSSQIDEIATVLWGMGKHFELTNDNNFVKSNWSNIQKGADFLNEQVVRADGLVETVGLWEEEFGSHTYSNSAIYGGLKEAAFLAQTVNQNDFSIKWDETAGNLRESLLNLAWDAKLNRFIKTVTPRNESIDISLLSLTYPFEVLPPSDKRIRKTAVDIESAFHFKVNGLGRYPSDQYYSGNPWILTTLWLALYYQKLGKLEKVEQLLKWALNNSTELGLLAEQIDKQTGKPISAIPLAWSHAFFILAALGFKEKM